METNPHSSNKISNFIGLFAELVERSAGSSSKTKKIEGNVYCRACCASQPPIFRNRGLRQACCPEQARFNQNGRGAQLPYRRRDHDHGTVGAL